jgi:hypothetical protein
MQPQPLPGNPQTANVVLDVNGNGQVSLGPMRPREHWQLTGAGVSVSTNVKEARCAIYAGPQIAASTFFGQTYTGSTGDTCGLGGLDIQSGMMVFAKWTGGDAGSTATLTVYGTYTIGVPS